MPPPVIKGFFSILLCGPPDRTSKQPYAVPATIPLPMANGNNIGATSYENGKIYQKAMFKIVPADADIFCLSCGSGIIILSAALTNPIAGKTGVHMAVLVETRATLTAKGGS